MPPTNPLDKSIDGAADAPLTARQIRAAILSALRAWRLQSKTIDAGTFDDFRHGALFDCVQKVSFRTLTQRDYPAVRRHFAALAGETWRPSDARTPAADDRRRALYVLDATIGKVANRFGGRAGAEAYARALLARIYHTTLDAASVRQIWGVVFTLGNRQKGKKK